MKKYIIISHSHCTDGLCSASLMKKALSSTGAEYTIHQLSLLLESKSDDEA